MKILPARHQPPEEIGLDRYHSSCASTHGSIHSLAFPSRLLLSDRQKRGHVRFHWSACASVYVVDQFPSIVPGADYLLRINGSASIVTGYRFPVHWPVPQFKCRWVRGLCVIRIMSVISLSTKSFAYSTYTRR